MEKSAPHYQPLNPPRSATSRRTQPFILYRYLWWECWSIFAVSLLAITVIVFMGRITRVMQLIITKGVGLADIGKFCLLLLPYLLLFTVPMAGMIAVLITFLRLSNDNEIMALKTSGLSALQLLPPIIGFSFLITGVTLFFSLYATPWGNQEMRQLLLDVTKRRADLGIREQVFNNDFDRVVLFVNNVTASGELLQGVFLSDDRDQEVPNVITADRARLLFDPKSERLVLQLFQGRVLRLSEDASSFHSVEFDIYQLPLELFQFAPRPKSEEEMYLSELRLALRQHQPGTLEHNKLLIEINRRFSLPLGVTIMVLTAMPLGISTQVRGRAFGLILGLGIFLLYYLLLTIAWRLGNHAMIPPAFAPWLPNLVFAGIAGFLWRRSLRDLPIAVWEGSWRSGPNIKE
ncbi:MAG: LPS export ABC transporter permease LptF [Deltaproteobacteria bacterium]|nr:LPS export ABC transporter permease LptF [Deltaproteobacteria bacterium]